MFCQVESDAKYELLCVYTHDDDDDEMTMTIAIAMTCYDLPFLAK